MNECLVLYGLTAKVRVRSYSHTGFFYYPHTYYLNYQRFTQKVRAVRVT